jgi:hypothetical protein
MIRLIINTIALGVAAALVPGIQLAGEGQVSILSLLLVALIFGLDAAAPIVIFLEER